MFLIFKQTYGRLILEVTVRLLECLGQWNDLLNPTGLVCRFTETSNYITVALNLKACSKKVHRSLCQIKYKNGLNGLLNNDKGNFLTVALYSAYTVSLHKKPENR